MDYEFALVTKVQVTDEDKTKLLSDIEELFKKRSCEICLKEVSPEVSGRRKLAYPIRGELEGVYTYYSVRVPSPAALRKVEEELKLNPKVSKHILRYLFIRKDNL